MQPIWGIEEEEALRGVVLSQKWGTLGPNAVSLASSFAEYVGVGYGIAVTSGTAALEVILRGLGIGFGDEVIVPAYICAAVASAVAVTGAAPVFADIGLPSCNISPDEIEKHVTGKTRAITAVHIAGLPCDMERICTIARGHHLYVIEDASHAHGAELCNRKAGSWGDAAAFSCGNGKIMTAGEGGLIVTGSREIYKECWRYHHAGRVLEDAAEFGGEVKLGTNARMTEFQACILRQQLTRLPEQIKRRRENAAYLTEKLAGVPDIQPCAYDKTRFTHAYCKFPLILARDEKHSLDEWISALNGNGVPVSKGYANISRESFLSLGDNYFRKTTGSERDYASVPLPNTDKAAGSVMWLPGYVLMEDARAIDRISDGIKKAADSIGGGISALRVGLS